MSLALEPLAYLPAQAEHRAPSPLRRLARAVFVEAVNDIRAVQRLPASRSVREARERERLDARARDAARWLLSDANVVGSATFWSALAGFDLDGVRRALHNRGLLPRGTLDATRVGA